MGERKRKIDVSRFEGHTPGPWSPAGDHVFALDSRCLFLPSNDTCLGDAQLAAAAPELLARVVELEEELELAEAAIDDLEAESLRHRRGW